MKIKVLSLAFAILLAIMASLFNTINLFALDTQKITDENKITYERKYENEDTKDTVVISSSDKAIKTIYAGGNQSAVLETDGVLHLSGENDVGYINPEAFKNVKDVSLGYARGIILKQDGSIITWGGVDGFKKQYQLPDRLNNVKSIKLGSNHILALQEDGKVLAWGSKNNLACNVPKGLSDVKEIAVGYDFSLALKNDGTVVAWGKNEHGLCNIPLGLKDVSSISADSLNVAAVKTDGSVVIWGYTNYSGFPNFLRLLNNVKTIVTGSSNIAAIKDNGDVVVFGRQENSIVEVPKEVKQVKALALGQNHMVALKEDNSIVAWGDNGSGELQVYGGTSKTWGKTKIILNAKDIDFPDVEPFINQDGRTLVPIRFVAEALKAQVDWEPEKNRVIIKKDKTIELQIGRNEIIVDGKNELIDTSAIIVRDRTYVPLRLISENFGATVEWNSGYKTVNIITKDATAKDFEFESVSAGNNRTMAINKYGKVFISGNTDSTHEDSTSGIKELANYYPLDNVTQACSNYNGALKEDGTIWIWGNEDFGYYKNEIVGGFKDPFQVIEAGSDNQMISDGVNKGMQMLKRDGSVWRFERKKETYSGNSTVYSISYSYSNTIFPIEGLTNVISIAGSDTQGLCIKEDRTVWEWDNSFKPHQVEGLENIIAVSAGEGYSIALSKDGNVYSWGKNSFGVLGNGTLIDSQKPVKIRSLSNIIAISANFHDCIALKKDGTIWTWGANDMGQCGVDKSVSYFKDPVEVNGLSDIKAIAAGKNHNTVIKNDGTVWNIGGNAVSNLIKDSTNSRYQFRTDIDYLNAKYNKRFKKVKQVLPQFIALDEEGILYYSYNTVENYNNGESEKEQLLSFEPKDLNNVVDFQTIYSNRVQGFALTKTGELWYFDDNYRGKRLLIKINGIKNAKSFAYNEHRIGIVTGDGKFAFYDCRDLVVGLETTAYYNDLENVNKGFDPISIPVPETKELKELETVIASRYGFWRFYIKGKDNRFIVVKIENENSISIKELSTQGEIINKTLESSNYLFALTQSGKVMKLKDYNKFETLEFENIKDISLTQKILLVGDNGILIVSDLYDDAVNHKKRANYFDLNIKEILNAYNVADDCEIEFIDSKNKLRIIRIDCSNNLYKEINTDKRFSDGLYYKILDY